MGTPANHSTTESACQAAMSVVTGSGGRSVAAIGVGSGEGGTVTSEAAHWRHE